MTRPYSAEGNGARTGPAAHLAGRRGLWRRDRRRLHPLCGYSPGDRRRRRGRDRARPRRRGWGRQLRVDRLRASRPRALDLGQDACWLCWPGLPRLWPAAETRKRSESLRASAEVDLAKAIATSSRLARRNRWAAATYGAFGRRSIKQVLPQPRRCLHAYTLSLLKPDERITECACIEFGCRKFGNQLILLRDKPFAVGHPSLGAFELESNNFRIHSSNAHEKPRGHTGFGRGAGALGRKEMRARRSTTTGLRCSPGGPTQKKPRAVRPGTGGFERGKRRARV